MIYCLDYVVVRNEELEEYVHNFVILSFASDVHRSQRSEPSFLQNGEPFFKGDLELELLEDGFDRPVVVMES